MRKILRALLILAAALYALALAYVLFFWSTAIGYDSGWRSLNLSLLSGIAAAYLSGDGLAGSQFMLNILLFVPLGFLLPLLFPRRAGALWRSALIALSVTLAAETIQYFIGRSADITDVIANFAGGVAGYALYALARALFCRFAFWEVLSRSDKKAKPLSAVAAALALLLIFGAPFALDFIDAHKPYGLFRFVSGSVPAYAPIRCDLSGADVGTAPVYRERIGIEEETANRLLAAFPAPEGAMREKRDTIGAFGGTALSVVAEDGTYRLTVYGNGRYHLSITAGEGAYPSDAEGFGSWVESLLPRLAPAGVTLALREVREEERGLVATADAAMEDGLASGELYFSYGAGELYVSSSVALADPAGFAETIRAQEALKAARGRDWLSFYYTGIEITSVELVFHEVRGVYLPCYAFHGTAVYNGETMPFQSVVDAVRR